MIRRSRFHSIRITLFAGAALFGSWEPALAQDTNPSAKQQGATASVDVADIIVTAQRRSERLQDVPISIQTLSAARLADQSITNVRELTTAIPGFNFTTVGAFALPSLRGVASQGTAAGLDPAVPTYLDGVYQSSTIASTFELSDISNIEVLEGPQGTLYGRNATGGAILITTRKPSFDFGGNASISYGTFNDLRESAFVTGGLVPDLLAFSLSGDHHSRDGYVADLVRGGKIADLEAGTVRGKLLLTPSPNVQITLTGMHQVLNDPTSAAGLALGGNSLSKRINPTLAVTTVPFTLTSNVPPLSKNRSDQASLNVHVDTNLGQINSVSGYEKTLSLFNQDADGGPAKGLQFTYRFPNKAYSQEVSFTSRKFGPVSLLAGALYFNQDAVGNLVANAAQDILGEQKIEAYAVYSELTIAPTGSLTLIGGLRYSHEHRDYVGQLAILPAPYVTVAVAGKSFDAVTPRLTAKYQITSALNVYASYNKAFKSGVFNPSGLVTTPVSPEKGTAYEVGAKFSAGKVRVNVAAFKYKFTDLQVASTVTNPLTGTTASRLQNAAGASIKGFSLDGNVEVVKEFSLSGGFTYVDAKYTRFPSATVSVPFPVAACPVGAYPCGNNSAATIDASGNPLNRAPKFTGNITAQYKTEAFGGEVTASVTGYHNSGFSWDAANRLRQPAYNTLAANLRWRARGTGLEVSVYGRNLTKELYSDNLAESAGGDLISYAEPRTFGVKLGYSF
jgi:iron complex outermembrane receptor protein